MTDKLCQFICGDEGATAIEYTLICAFIALAIVAVVITLGTNLRGSYQQVSDSFK